MEQLNLTWIKPKTREKTLSLLSDLSLEEICGKAIENKQIWLIEHCLENGLKLSYANYWPLFFLIRNDMFDIIDKFLIGDTLNELTSINPSIIDLIKSRTCDNFATTSFGITSNFYRDVKFIKKYPNVYLSEDFVSKTCDIRGNNAHLKKEFYATYGRKNSQKCRCNFVFHLVNIYIFDNSTKLYAVFGMSGDCGFGMHSKRFTLATYARVQCLTQLYEHLEKLEKELLITPKL